ncbi:hypothetical protein EFK50_07620 [Nocardioides marmoriginsengisoli]|uniref:Uncharacterized protein n=1 Tax=Nocardioides marmoriginsengisoli TaxID=661483 RepID=A0A3N0CLN1_9ACTN|nr:hypothetical protein EFK50_07620 [Nocardioides marmoriginsengisoli]
MSAVGSVIGAVGGLAGFASLYFQRKDSVRQTKFRVAPFVYCTMEGAVNAGEDVDHESRFTTKFDREFGKELFKVWEGSHGVPTSLVPSGPLAGYHIQVSNYSDEPVSGTMLKVLHPVTNEPVLTKHPIGLGTLNPKTAMNVSIYVPRDWEPGVTGQANVQVTFTDSAGHKWKRVEGNPPEEDD